jgi:hypothetical protein
MTMTAKLLPCPICCEVVTPWGVACPACYTPPHGSPLVLEPSTLPRRGELLTPPQWKPASEMVALIALVLTLTGWRAAQRVAARLMRAVGEE